MPWRHVLQAKLEGNLGRALAFGLGFLPLQAIAMAATGLLPLHLSAPWVLAASLFGLLALGWAAPALRGRLLAGWVAGLLATLAYDATRWPLAYLGWWPDFIPAIGQLAFDDPSASPLWGYAWRYTFNGGGLGLAFAMLPWRSARWGLAYGTLLCLGLWGTLLLGGPGAETALFPLTPATAVFSLVGHLDFGVVLALALGSRRLVAWAP